LTQFITESPGKEAKNYRRNYLIYFNLKRIVQLNRSSCLTLLFLVGVICLLWILEPPFVSMSVGEPLTTPGMSMDMHEMESYQATVEIWKFITRKTTSGQLSLFFIKNTGDTEINHVVLGQLEDDVKTTKFKIRKWDSGMDGNTIILHKQGEKILLPDHSIVLMVLTDAAIPKFEIKIAANSIDRSIVGLDVAETSKTIELTEGAMFQLEAKPIAKRINGSNIRMYGYNGQIPGPMLKVKQGSSISVNFTNSLDMETTVHWHGLRLENKNDGVPGLTQETVKPGETFLYKLDFPDEGVYWYHSHFRGDIQMELGLYANILVEPSSEKYFNSVDREVALFIDDIRIVNDDVDIFSKDYARFTLMGRFGNNMLVNGDTEYQLDVKKGEVVRFYLTNSANTRVFKFSIEGHQLKLVGSDASKYEKESFVDYVTIAPSERYIIEVLFEKAGTFKILHSNPQKTYTLGTVKVSETASVSEKSADFYTLKENDEIIAEFEPFRKYLLAEPDFEIGLTIEMEGMEHRMDGMMDGESIEWEDNMPMMNSMSTNRNTKWILTDKVTGKQNLDMNLQAKVGDIKKIRLFDDPKSLHPMHHPIHIHGQHFLVLSQDGKSNDNLVWKDLVLVPKGGSVDILVYFTYPGDWLLHCHNLEHMEAGMMTVITVSQ